MVTQGEAVGNLPPVLGTINVQVTTKRPDLQSVLGHVVRVPRGHRIPKGAPTVSHFSEGKVKVSQHFALGTSNTSMDLRRGEPPEFKSVEFFEC